MTKKQRMLSALRGDISDGIPSLFSIHFPKEKAFGAAAVDAHLQFLHDTDCDVLKIMNENLIPPFAEVRCAADLRAFPGIRESDPAIAEQLALTDRILEKCDPAVFTMGTLHGVTTAFMYHPFRAENLGYNECRRQFTQWMREDPAPVLDALDRAADGLCLLAQSYIRHGLDAVFFASLGAERRFGLTREEFARFIEPYDKRVLTAIHEAGGYAFFHVCNSDVNMGYYEGYAPFIDAANWGVYQAPLSLEEGSRLFGGKPIWGGLPNRTGALVDGSEAEIQKAVLDVLNNRPRGGFILGADCTLGTEQDLTRVNIAVEAARNYKEA